MIPCGGALDNSCAVEPTVESEPEVEQVPSLLVLVEAPQLGGKEFTLLRHRENRIYFKK